VDSFQQEKIALVFVGFVSNESFAEKASRFVSNGNSFLGFISSPSSLLIEIRSLQ
jgi:hypothetical protein